MPGEVLIGVEDQAAGAGVQEVRVRERTAGLGMEQVVLPFSSRKRLGVYKAYSDILAVQAAAHAANAGVAIFINRSTAQMAAIRYIDFFEYPTAVTVFPTAPRIVADRVTHTGTPSGTLITPSKRVRTTQNNEVADAANVAEFRMATTGLTVTAGERGIMLGVITPVLIVFAAGTQAQGLGKTWRYMPTEDEQMILANGEGLLFRQADAGTASDTRKYGVNICWEEYTIP